MLHHIHDDGTLIWQCHKPERHPDKPKQLNAHVSHDAVQYVAHDLVALPPCPHCAAQGIHSQTFVKVRFTDEELQADNMLQYGMVPTEMTLPHAITGEAVPVMIPALKAIGPNPAIARHKKLAELMEQHGKCYEPAAPHDDTSDPNA